MGKAEPPAWGNDSLSEFIKFAYENSFATFVNKKYDFELLGKIDGTFRFLIRHLSDVNDEVLLPTLMVYRSCHSYLGSARLSTSCQVTESYMVQRGCLESALYGLYFYKNPESQETWLKRHDDEESFKKVRGNFTATNLFKLLKDMSPEIHRIAKNLYDETINFGAHPNPNAILSNLTISEMENPKGITRKIEPHIMTVDPVVIWACIKTNIEIGICTLDIFGLIFSERYQIMDIPKKIEKHKEDLRDLLVQKKKEHGIR